MLILLARIALFVNLQGMAMNDFRRLCARALFVLQTMMVLWLGQRAQFDLFTQLVLLPLLLLTGLALLSLQQADD